MTEPMRTTRRGHPVALLFGAARILGGCGAIGVSEPAFVSSPEPTFPLPDAVDFQPGWEQVGFRTHSPAGDEASEAATRVRGGTYGDVQYACDGSESITIEIRDASVESQDESLVALLTSDCQSAIRTFSFAGPDRDAPLAVHVIADAESSYWAVLAVPAEDVLGN